MLMYEDMNSHSIGILIRNPLRNWVIHITELGKTTKLE